LMRVEPTARLSSSFAGGISVPSGLRPLTDYYDATERFFPQSKNWKLP
jgi:hypothetical protein